MKFPGKKKPTSADPELIQPAQPTGCQLLKRFKHKISSAKLSNESLWLRSAFDAIDDLIFIKNRNSEVIWGNKAFRDYQGITEDKTHQSYHTPSDLDDTVQYLKDDHSVYTSGASLDVPSEGITNAEGITHFFHTIKSPLFDQDRCINGLIGVSRRIRSTEEVDRSREQRAERKLQLAYLKSFIHRIPITVAMLDAKMQFIACSKTWNSFFSPGIEIPADSSYLERFERMLRLQTAYEATLRSGEAKILRGIHIENASGREVIVNVNLEPWFIPTGELGGAIVYIEELTPEKKSVEALRNSEENLSITLNSLSEGVIATDADGRIQRMNPEAEALTGWTASRAKNRQLNEVLRLIELGTNRPLINPATQVKAAMSTVHLPDKTGLIDRNGIRHTVDVIGAPMHNSRGHLFGLVFVIRDETEQHRLDEEFQQIQKMDSIGKIAGGVAHDFNNMLGGIMGATELLEEELADRPELAKYIKIIFRCSQQAADLTDKLLVFSRKEKPIFQPVSIHECITNVLDGVAHGTDPVIHLHHKFNAKNDQIMGNGLLLKNAILNLYNNAREAIKTEGVITIETDNLVLIEEDALTTTFSIPHGEYLRVRVKDTGCGIADDIKELIFEPFFTTKASGKGSGLGLAAVYGIVKSHHGGIQAHSETNNGTTVELFLPLAQTEMPDQPAEPAQRSDICARILLIDDEIELREASAELIRRFGHEVLCAANGVVGMKIYHEQADEIDLILLDLAMPGKPGIECLREIHEIKPEAKVIICSGYATEDTIAELQALGVFRILHKPFRRTDLLAAIENALILN